MDLRRASAPLLRAARAASAAVVLAVLSSSAAAAEEGRVDLGPVAAKVDEGAAATEGGDAKLHRAYLSLRKALAKAAPGGLPGDFAALKKAAKACTTVLSGDAPLRSAVGAALDEGALLLRSADADLLGAASLLAIEKNREKVLRSGSGARAKSRAAEMDLALGEDADAAGGFAASAKGFAKALALAERLLAKETPSSPVWSAPLTGLGGALLGAWGESGPSPRLYAVGADDGEGALFLVLHPGAEAWVRVDAGAPGTTLRWVAGVPGDGVWACGDDGLVVRYDPATGDLDDRSTDIPAVLYGLWGSGPNDVWVVGGSLTGEGPPAVIAHWDGEGWTESVLPEAVGNRTIYKVWGLGSDDLYVVGQGGLLLRGDGTNWTPGTSGTSSTLITVHGADPVVAVGGGASAVAVESADGGAFATVSVKGAGSGSGGQFPGPVQALLGVHVTPAGEGYAVGMGRGFVRRTATGWVGVSGVPAAAKDLHAVWMDDEGNAVAVGGDLSDLDSGVLVAYGKRRIPAEIVRSAKLRGALADLLYASCAHSGCHLPPFANAGVHFSTPEAIHALTVGVPSEQSPLLRVSPGRPSQSYLWHKLLGTHLEVGGSGVRMPDFHLPGDRFFDEEELALVRGWILDGARDD
ncbi:MAG: hypothetical protein L6R43_05750 [Planctomycetes bacterium]|nr:hypothetical protein [Planctomycetota bacterium]